MTDTTARDDEAPIKAAYGTWARLRLPGSAGLAAATQLACRPDRPSRLMSAVPAPEGRSLIARGAGQSSGDAAINDGGAVALTGRMDRMLSFDAASRVLVAEAGVTLGDILATFLPSGFALAVCPGTSAATIGGAIATDAHGWNHVRAGSFADHVVWLDLVTSRGGLRRISREDEPTLFAATIGGLGLTGIIARAAIRLAPAPAPTIAVRRRAIAALDVLVEELAAAARAHDHAWAWIDVAAGGIAQGRGVLETGDNLAGDGPAAGRRTWRPAPLARRLRWPAGLARLLDERRYRAAARTGDAVRHVPLDRFLFGPEGERRPRREFGRRDVARFTCVVSPDGAAAGLRRLLDTARRGGGVAHASAHTLGEHGVGMLSFARPGMALSLDLPARLAVPDLMHRLEREVLDRGGRIFLAGDTNLTDHGFAAMYPRLGEMRDALARIDPDMRLQSNLARRLRLRDYVV